jgi:hypothetical protein
LFHGSQADSGRGQETRRQAYPGGNEVDQFIRRVSEAMRPVDKLFRRMSVSLSHTSESLIPSSQGGKWYRIKLRNTTMNKNRPKGGE